MKAINSSSPLVRVPIKFGLVGALLSIVVMLVLFYSGRHPSIIPPYLDSRILIFFILIYFAIREYKDLHNNGYLHFWEGMIIGVISYLTVGIIGGLFVLIFGSLETEFLARYIEMATEGINTAKQQLVEGPQGVRMSEEEFQRHLTSLKKTTPAILAVDYFIKSCIVGFFVPLLYSIFFRKVDR